MKYRHMSAGAPEAKGLLERTRNYWKHVECGD